MSKIREHLSGSVGLLRAAEVASNWQAFVLLAGGGFIALVLVLVGAKLAPGSWVVAALFGFLALAAFLAGASATGIVLMDDAKDLEPRSLINAALAGLFTLPRFFGLGILVAITFMLYMLAIALLFFVCKIPGLGPLLYAFVFPATALLTGVAYLAFMVSLLVLAAPMIWEGRGVMATLARLWAVLKQRLLMVFMNWILLSLLVAFVGTLVMAIVTIGTLVTLPISASIIGQRLGGAGFSDLLALGMYGGFQGGEVASYVLAGIFGSAILAFIAFTLPGLVHTKGVCLIYLAAVEGLELDAAEAALAQRMADVKQRAEAAQQRSMQTTPKTTKLPPTMPIAEAAPAATEGVVSFCPKCGTGVNSGDMFCESCGHRLR